MSKARRPPPPITDTEEARIQAGIAADPDNPEISDEQFARMRPASEVLPPALFSALTRPRGRPKAAVTKVAVKLRLDPVALDAWKASGAGWQSRINDLIVREAPKAGKHG